MYGYKIYLSKESQWQRKVSNHHIDLKNSQNIAFLWIYDIFSGDHPLKIKINKKNELKFIKSFFRYPDERGGI